MGYQEAIEANDFVVKDFKEFGSYQGTWIAIIETEDGDRFIEGSYGSCSGCDAFQAEFDYSDEPSERDGKYYVNYEETTKEEHDKAAETYKQRLKKFGESYTDDQQTKEEIVARYEKKCAEEYAWDDDKEILEWLKSL
jgi:hypothetical protein